MAEPICHGDPARDLCIVANAYGIPFRALAPLVNALARSKFVVTWEGLHATDPTLVGEHPHMIHELAQIDALLERFGSGTCSLVGWCSGAALVLEYATRHPARVDRLALLNGTYVQVAHEKTPYQHQLEMMLPDLAEKPSFAEFCRKMMSRPSAASTPTPGIPSEQQEEFHRLRQHPFRSALSSQTYARYIVDCGRSVTRRLNHELLGEKTLVIGSELDQIAHPSASEEVAKKLRCRCVVLENATHYAPLTSPALVAGLITN